MLKKEFKFKNLNDEDVVIVKYFNLSKTEIVKLEVSRVGGFANMMNTIIENADAGAVVEVLDEFILMSVGRKSEDGNKFDKEGARQEFQGSIAYNILFDELMTDGNNLAMFVKGILPADLAAGITPEKLKEMGIEYTENPDGTVLMTNAPDTEPTTAPPLYGDNRTV